LKDLINIDYHRGILREGLWGLNLYSIFLIFEGFLSKKN